MLPYRDGRFVRILLIAFFVLVFGYGLYEAQGMLFGPTIALASDTQIVHEPFIAIRGQARHITSLSMNGKEIAVTEEGAFEQPFVLAPGLNHIVFDATDKYGRKRQRILQVVYVDPAANPTAIPPTDDSADTAATTSSLDTESAD